MGYDQLKLDNQICFPLYAASRLVIRLYQPYLDRLQITYPQYLVLLVLWERDGVCVGTIADKLILNTNTLTPLLKRMEEQKLIKRRRDEVDERKVIVVLEDAGRELEAAAAAIPGELVKCVVDEALSVDELLALKVQLQQLISHLDVINMKK